jgi:hypothetical protein
MHFARRFFRCRTRPSENGWSLKRVGVSAQGLKDRHKRNSRRYRDVGTDGLNPARIERLISHYALAPPINAVAKHHRAPASHRYVDPRTRRYFNKSSIDIRLFPVLGDVEAGGLNIRIGP